MWNDKGLMKKIQDHMQVNPTDRVDRLTDHMYALNSNDRVQHPYDIRINNPNITESVEHPENPN